MKQPKQQMIADNSSTSKALALQLTVNCLISSADNSQICKDIEVSVFTIKITACVTPVAFCGSNIPGSVQIKNTVVMRITYSLSYCFLDKYC